MGAGTGGRALAGPGAPFVQGFVAAALAHGIGLYWMVPSLWWRTTLAIPAYLLVLVMIGIVAGAACEAAVALHRRKRWPLPLALAVCWTGFEWTAVHVPGVSYAWLNAGGSLAWYPAAAAGAELLGARILTVWTVACGAMVGLVLRRAGGSLRGSLRLLVLLLGVVAVPLAAGHLRQRMFDEGEVAARVAAVQAGHGEGGGDEAVGDEAARDVAGSLTRWLAALRDSGQAEPFDLAVFPERFLAAPLTGVGGGAPTEAGRAVADLAVTLGTPVLVGALDGEVGGGGGTSGGDTVWYNAAFLREPGRGLSPAYRKSRLVPGLEGSGWWPSGVFGFRERGYAPGRAPRPLPLGDGAVGVMVCYDSAYGETARALVRGGADWLAVLSNDDWLDPERPFTVTWAYWQHATHGRLRAIENRVALIQVAATGYTFAVSPGGEGPPLAMEPGTEGIAVVTARRRGATTLYTRIGDVLGVACFLAFCCGVFLARPSAARTNPGPRWSHLPVRALHD